MGSSLGHTGRTVGHVDMPQVSFDLCLLGWVPALG